DRDELATADVEVDPAERLHHDVLAHDVRLRDAAELEERALAHRTTKPGGPPPNCCGRADPAARAAGMTTVSPSLRPLLISVTVSFEIPNVTWTSSGWPFRMTWSCRCPLTVRIARFGTVSTPCWLAMMTAAVPLIPGRTA